MKKMLTLTCLLSLLFLNYDLLAQNDCASSNSIVTLNGNNVTATLPHAGSLWWDGGDAGYTVDDGFTTGTVHSIFAGGVWMGGYGADGNLKLAASQYGLGGNNVDFYPGPLDENGETMADNCSNWDRHFETTGTDINDFLTDFADGTIDNPIPNSILGWPGAGNPEFFSVYGFELPANNFNLAPFVDNNGDGIYNPNDGDHPNINDASQAVFWIFNDAGNTHNESGGEQLKFECHMTAYAYESSDENIDNATFYDLKVINKSSIALYDMFCGLWVDFDLGCSSDDYIGCLPSENLGFVYNADDLDGDAGANCPGGVSTFADQIPVAGVKILDGVRGDRIFDANGELSYPPNGVEPDTIIDCGMSSFTYYNNGGGNPAPPPGTDDPDIAPEYYNILSGKWKDGTPLTVGGNGYNLGSTDITSYALSGDPENENEWSMCSENLQERDRRVVLGSGPFTMNPGQINTMTFAVIHVPNIEHPCPSSSVLSDATDAVTDFYDIVTSTETLLKESVNVTAFPNPFSDATLLQFSELEGQVQRVQVFNIAGQLVRSYEDVSGGELTIQRAGLESGMYFYKLVTNAQQYVGGKIIVQ